MEVPESFKPKDSNAKLIELLTRKPEDLLRKCIYVSELELRVVKDGNEFFITYSNVAHSENGIKTKFTIVQPKLGKEKDLRDLLCFVDHIRDYHRGYHGYKVMNLGFKDTKKRQGGIAEITLWSQMTQKDLIEAVKEFYPEICEEFEVLSVTSKG